MYDEREYELAVLFFALRRKRTEGGRRTLYYYTQGRLCLVRHPLLLVGSDRRLVGLMGHPLLLVGPDRRHHQILGGKKGGLEGGFSTKDHPIVRLMQLRAGKHSSMQLFLRMCK
jgi:hypothetical protein